ncbi:MAG TPA: phosphotransferase [Puia sp.]|jgi:Ser/Thr protein kinase RdoA (MazF antagonist)|nr:phosphotransferase [Puia sp.]
MNNLFPATYSTLSALALAEFIRERYGFISVECEMILRGVGDTYLVKTRENAMTGAAGSGPLAAARAARADTQFILRVYRPDQRSLAQIKAEMDLLLALKERGIPVSWPIADKLGLVIQTVDAIEGAKHMVLFSFAPGRSVVKLNEKQLYTLGYQMARLHVASQTIELEDKRWTFDVETTMLRPLERVRALYVHDPEGYAWLQRAVTFAGEKLTELDAASLPSGICHYDFLPKNFHFDGDDITFFDFDFFGYGAFANDIMSFWQHISIDAFHGRLTPEEFSQALATFLRGYEAVRRVSEREMAAIPYLSLGFWLFYMNFHMTHDQFYPFIQADHLKLRTDFIRKLMARSWDKAFFTA